MTIQHRFSLYQLYEPVANGLNQVEELIEETLATANSEISAIVETAKSYRGKMIRPALLLLAGTCSEKPLTKQHICAAAAVEMLHSATLLHDDVIDSAIMRRGCTSMNAAWGDHISIVTGDLYYGIFLQLLAMVESHTVNEIMSQTVRNLCEGELIQLSHRGSVDLDESQYLMIIELKTGSLISAACAAGAVLSDMPEAERLAEYGRKLGMAFQIIDDCIDLAGNERTAGKTLGCDLFEAEVTLPGIYLLQDVPESKRPKAIEMLTHSKSYHDRSSAAEMMQEYNSLNRAVATAERLISDAKRALADLPDTEGKKNLLHLSDFVREQYEQYE